MFRDLDVYGPSTVLFDKEYKSRDHCFGGMGE